MRLLLILIALLSVSPASAQLIGPPSTAKAPRAPRPTFRLPDASVSRDMRDVDRQIDRGREAGTLTRREARRAGRENDQIGTLADRYASDGVLSDAERRELAMRSAVLRDQVNAQRLKGGGRK